MKKHILKFTPYLALALFVGIFSLLLDAASNIAIMRTIDSAMNPARPNLTTLILWLMGITAAMLPANILLAWAKANYRKRAMIGLKKHYLQNVFKKDIAAFNKDHATDYVSAMTQDMNTIENGYVLGLFEVFYQGLSFVIGIGLIAYINPLIPIVSIALSVIIGVLSSLLGKPVQRHQKRRSELFTHYTNYIHSCLSAFHIIKVNQLGEKVKADFYQKSQAVQHQGFVIDRLNTFIFALQNVLMTSIMLGIVGFSVYLTIKGNMTFGGAVLIINSAEKVFGPLMAMGEWFPKITASKILFAKMDAQLATAAEEATITDLPSFSQEIKLSGVSFHYGETPILNDVNLSLKKGEKYLVVGPSGGGKSTLLRLLRKYHKPQSGTITIDGQALDTISADAYFQQIANVEQHVFLFEDTLRNNLCLYKDYSDADIDSAIKRSGLKTLIGNLPQGLETMIYDNGKNLSGGEKSRIAIARGLLQKASIMLLDEAFSSLDDQVARLIEETLLSLEDVTVINVTHVVFPENQHKYHKTLRVSHSSVA